MSMRITSAKRHLAIVLSLLTLAGCKGSTSTSTAPSQETSGASALVKVSGDAQTDTVGQTLPQAIWVRVNDAAGSGVPGVALTWSVTSGGGTLSASSTTTDATGQSSATWTLGTTAGTNTIQVAATGLSAISFSATGTPGPAYKLAVVTAPSDTSASGSPFARQPVLQVRDSYNNDVAQSGIGVTAQILSGGGTLNGTTTANTNSSGRATFTDLSITGSTGNRAINFSAAGGLSSVTALVTITNAVATGLQAQSMSAGSSHTCAITTTGVAYCWGWNSAGQLGDDSTTARLVPIAVSGGHTWQLLSAGFQHTCGVTTGGALYCWGDNSGGALGTGVLSGGAAQANVPVPVSGGGTYSLVDVGTDYSCALTSGSAKCWGDNGYNELGDGTSTRAFTPVTVLGSLAFTTLSAGMGYHTCALTAAGVAYCWGGNSSGQLGDSSSTNRSSPVAVKGGRTYSSITARGSHTCALTSTGVAYCWGANNYGQVGVDPANFSLRIPTAVNTSLVFQSIYTGYLHTCGLTAAGTAYCWGQNANGQLGDGSVVARSTPTIVSGSLVFTTLALGSYHTCGITTNGAVYCWGANSDGRLGDGTWTQRTVPTAVHAP